MLINNNLPNHEKIKFILFRCNQMRPSNKQDEEAIENILRRYISLNKY